MNILFQKLNSCPKYDRLFFVPKLSNTFKLSPEGSVFGLCSAWQCSNFFASWRLFWFLRKHGLKKWHKMTQVIKQNVTIVAPTKYKVSKNHLRVRMMETMAGKMMYTPPFVKYDTGLKDNLSPWSCWNNSQMAVYLMMGNQIEKTQNFCVICNARYEIHVLPHMPACPACFISSLPPASFRGLTCCNWPYNGRRPSRDDQSPLTDRTVPWKSYRW